MTHEIDIETQLTVLLGERGSSVPPPNDAWDRLEARLPASLPDVGLDQPIGEWGFTPDEEWSFPPEDENEDARSIRRWPVVLTGAAAAVVILVLILSRGDASTEQPILTDDIEQPAVTTPQPTTPSTLADLVVLPSVVDPVSSYRWSRVATDDEAVFGQHVEEVMNSVLVGGPGLVAVGSAVWTSVDGITWSRVPDDDAIFAADVGERAVMTSITAGGPGLIAVGDADDGAAVWSSVDGLTWSRVPHDEALFGGAAMTSVTAGGPGLVAVGAVGSGYDFEVAAVWTSVDGLTWSRVPHDEAVFGGGGQGMNSVTVGGPGLVAVGRDEPDINSNGEKCCLRAAVWTSVDGIIWTRVPDDEAVFDGPGGQEMNSVAAAGSGLVAVGDEQLGDDVPTGRAKDAAVWTSVDGITWSRVPHDVTLFGGTGNQRMHGVTVTDAGLVAVGADGGFYGTQGDAVVWTSVDGITWARVPHDESVFGGAEMQSVTGTSAGLVAVGDESLESKGTAEGQEAIESGDSVFVWVAQPES
jgi:hypothetical protein